MVDTGLQNVENYVYCHYNTVEHFIATSPIMDLCLVAEQRPGPRITRRWWEQDGVDLEGMQTEAREEE